MGVIQIVAALYAGGVALSITLYKRSAVRGNVRPVSFGLRSICGIDKGNPLRGYSQRRRYTPHCASLVRGYRDGNA
jgi:hypothetical protein